eukprot:gene24612-32055_t
MNDYQMDDYYEDIEDEERDDSEGSNTLVEGDGMPDSLLIEHLEIELAESQLKGQLLENDIAKLTLQLQNALLMGNGDKISSFSTPSDTSRYYYDSRSFEFEQYKYPRTKLSLTKMIPKSPPSHSMNFILQGLNNLFLNSRSFSSIVIEQESLSYCSLNDCIVASKALFNYSVQLINQMNLHAISAASSDGPTKATFTNEDNNLLRRLLLEFPLSGTERIHQENICWLPVHLSLALDLTQMSASAISTYLIHLRLILKCFGMHALSGDISPLSIAVASAQPDLTRIQILLDRSNWSLDQSFLNNDQDAKSLQPANRGVSERTEMDSQDNQSSKSKLLHNKIQVDDYFPCSWLDGDGTAPLIHACSHNTSAEVVALLISRWPQSLAREDGRGWCAIHHAAFRGWGKVVKQLLEFEPVCAYLEGGEGALPLHYAVQNSATGEANQLEVIHLLLHANPFAALKADSLGALPLHLAVLCSDLPAIQLVHQSFPDAIFVEDGEGLLPIHYYSLRQKSGRRLDSDVDMIIAEYLLQANPQSSVREFDPAAYDANVASSRMHSAAGSSSSSTLSASSISNATIDSSSNRKASDKSNSSSQGSSDSSPRDGSPRPSSWRRFSWSPSKIS